MVIGAPHYKLSVKQYDKMVDCDVFPPGAKLELLDGELIEMSPQGDRHHTVVRELLGLVYAAGVAPGTVDAQGPMRLSAFSEPEPDLILLKQDRVQYRGRKAEPRDVVVVVEVSFSSRNYDLYEKLPRYAEAGIPEVWVVDLLDNVVRVYRQPAGGRYVVEKVASQGESIAPDALPSLQLQVSDILELT